MSEYVVGFPDAWDAVAQDAMRAEAPEGFAPVFFDPSTPDGLNDILARSHYLIAGSFPITEAVLESAPNLRLVQRWGAGVDSVDLDAAKAAGVKVAITAGANAHAVAEHAVMLILAVQRRLLVADRAVREGNWVPVYNEMRAKAQQLRGKTVGIIGFGHIGRAVAKRLVGFEVDVLYSDPRRASAEIEQALGVEYVDLDELLLTADVITIHASGGAETERLLDAEALAKLKPNAVLVNAARGTIVDEDALADALREGRLFGAGTDVYPVEPIHDDNPLVPLENVVLSPHTAAAVFDNVSFVAAHAFRNIKAHAAGEALPPLDEIV